MASWARHGGPIRVVTMRITHWEPLIHHRVGLARETSRARSHAAASGPNPFIAGFRASQAAGGPRPSPAELPIQHVHVDEEGPRRDGIPAKVLAPAATQPWRTASGQDAD